MKKFLLIVLAVLACCVTALAEDWNRDYRESVGRIGTSIRTGIDFVVIAKITFLDIIAI